MPLHISAPAPPSSIPFSPEKSVLAAVAEHQLNSSATAVLLLLAEHAWGAKDHCWPSVPRLASLLGKTDRTIQRALSDLKKAGLIREQGADNRTGRVLLLTWKGDRNVTPGDNVDSLVTPLVKSMSPLGDKEVTTPGDRNVTQNSDSKDQRTTTKREAGVVVSFPFSPDIGKAVESPDSQGDEDGNPDWWDWESPEDLGPAPLSRHTAEDLEPEWAEPEKDWLPSVFNRIDSKAETGLSKIRSQG